MKKAFTLVELLIVVVVIVTLMTIVFKLAGVGDDATQRNVTINRMQRLENCLSGYYAAFGSYPPVKLHGSRDYQRRVDIHGIQSTSGETESTLSWESVDAACRSQPIAMCFPFHESLKDYVKAYSDLYAEKDPSDPTRRYEALYSNSSVSPLGEKSDWQEVQIYKFGVMSYLLPRYLVIMGGSFSQEDRNNRLDYQLFDNQRQWTDNNQLPSNFDDGMPYTNWRAVNEDVNNTPWKVAALPSQAVCARWLPNLAGIVSSVVDRTIYGVNICDTAHRQLSTEVYSPGGYNSSSQQYLLDCLTVKDYFWRNGQCGNDFYYYSPPPHQSYRLWSSGPNWKTFPPWVTNEELNKLPGADRKTVQTWIADDIVHMSN